MGSASSTPLPPTHPTPAPSGPPPPGCPMHTSTPSDPLNPLNNIPSLAQKPSPNQKIQLPLERTVSSIPKPAYSNSEGPSACPVAHGAGGGGGVEKEKENQWEYPSPQQFYNALVRKGWETPEDSVEMMVSIHNWLNEAAWEQVRGWEERHAGGDRSSLAKFEGRPKDLSPKARYHLMMGRLFPATYGSLRPFDRHDWTIHRPIPSSPSSSYTSSSPTQAYSTHRYVIDYYSLPEDAEGNPVFSLDVRPAVDSVEAVRERVGDWWERKKEVWAGWGKEDESGLGEGMKGQVGVRVQEEK